MKSDLQYETSDKRDWLKNHTLSEEEVKRIIRNKYERAKKDQERIDQIRQLVYFTD